MNHCNLGSVAVPVSVLPRGLHANPFCSRSEGLDTHTHTQIAQAHKVNVFCVPSLFAANPQKQLRPHFTTACVLAGLVLRGIQIGKGGLLFGFCCPLLEMQQEMGPLKDDRADE